MIAATTDKVPLLRGIGLTKLYGNFVALSDASVTLMPGEVRALIGSNGAGKSTLVKVLTGAVTPTMGTVEIGGEPAPLGDPREMIRRGLACIYQHSNLAPAMSVLLPARAVVSSRSIRRPWRSEVVAVSISLTMDSRSSASDSIAPVSG